jgi:hypothetical protein
MVYYKFKNDEKAGLGIPIPAGNVRVYQKDSKGGILFVGEDRIDHTPKDENISVHIGNAFDVVSERKQTDFKSIASNVWEMEFEITLRNHNVPITVGSTNPSGDWEMWNSSYKYTKPVPGPPIQCPGGQKMQSSCATASVPIAIFTFL